MSWKICAILSSLAGFFIALLVKKITSLKGYGPEVTIAWFTMLVSVCMFIACHMKGQSLIPAKGSTPWIVLLGLVEALFLLFFWNGMGISPNPAYVIAIINANAVFVAIASWMMFGSEMNLLKVSGIFLVVAGVIILLAPTVKIPPL